MLGHNAPTSGRKLCTLLNSHADQLPVHTAAPALHRHLLYVATPIRARVTGEKLSDTDPLVDSLTGHALDPSKRKPPARHKLRDRYPDPCVHGLPAITQHCPSCVMCNAREPGLVVHCRSDCARPGERQSSQPRPRRHTTRNRRPSAGTKSRMFCTSSTQRDFAFKNNSYSACMQRSVTASARAAAPRSAPRQSAA